MTKASADRITFIVAALGLCTTIAAFFAFGASAATSTGVGATLALANLLSLRTLVGRITTGELANKGPVVALLFFKMGALMGLVFLVVSQKWVEPIAFMVGLSTLVVGLISAALFISSQSNGSSNDSSNGSSQTGSSSPLSNTLPRSSES